MMAGFQGAAAGMGMGMQIQGMVDQQQAGKAAQAAPARDDRLDNNWMYQTIRR
jgi:hypothetical protein